MNLIMKLLTRPMILLVLLGGSLLLSFSFSIRFSREETTKIDRLEGSLLRLRDLRQRMEAPATGVPLLADTGVYDPLQDLPGAMRRSVTLKDPVARRSLGGGLDRLSAVLELQEVDPDEIGRLLSLLEGDTRGWWVTGATLEAFNMGLNGQLKLEALDSPSVED